MGFHSLDATRFNFSLQPARPLRIQPQHMHLTVLSHRPYQPAVGIEHQPHRIVEGLLANRIGSLQLDTNPTVGLAIIHQPGGLIRDVGTDQDGVGIRQVGRLA